MIEFTLNQQVMSLDIDGDTPLLWVLRENLNLQGTKFGCGKGLCGACTVHVNGAAMRSCTLPVAAIAGQNITTIEAVGENGLSPVQQAWVEANVPQCGYCQSGQIMSATALLAENSQPSDADIDAAMSGNICRCGMYGRIRSAIHRAAELTRAQADGDEGDMVQMFDPAAAEVRTVS